MFPLNIIVSLALFAHVSSMYLQNLNKKVDLLEKKSQAQALEIQNLKTEISDLKSSLNDNQDEMDRLTTGLMANKWGFNTSENNYKIAFDAHLAYSIANLNPNQTIVFDAVQTNHGNAYSDFTGIFTAPQRGMYAFYVHILGSNRPMETSLRKNDRDLVLLYSQGPGYLGSDDGTAVVELAKGDRVYVAKHGNHGVAPFYVHLWFSTFAGYMLYPL